MRLLVLLLAAPLMSLGCQRSAPTPAETQMTSPIASATKTKPIEQIDPNPEVSNEPTKADPETVPPQPADTKTERERVGVAEFEVRGEAGDSPLGKMIAEEDGLLRSL